MRRLPLHTDEYFGSTQLNARVKTQRKLKEWRYVPYGGDNYRGLATILGKDPTLNDVGVLTEDDLRLCDMLCGPNGYTVFKMILARQNDA